LSSQITWLTPNETELAILSGMPAKTVRQIEIAARKLLATGLPNVVVTCGSRGACWISPGKTIWFPAAKVKAVDTVGAGDCFSGTFAAGLCRGLPPESAVRLAVAAATRNVLRRGAQG
jgi:ribokinase